MRHWTLSPPGGLKGRLQARLPATRGSHIDASGLTSNSSTSEVRKLISGFPTLAETPREGRDESRPGREECLRHENGLTSNPTASGVCSLDLAGKSACTTSYILLLAATLLSSACGYHIGGQGDLIPKTVKTIAIPEFSNGTVQYQVAPLLTADVVREFHSRTHYTIVTDPGKADAVLAGAVANFSVLGGITTDPVTNRATSSQVVLTVQFTLTDRHTGKVIYQRSGYEFRQRYEISSSLPTYFDESSPAIKRVTRDAAQAVVTSILEAF
jgi:outer membrane lipopolysaccharide assembly protein LptE/RlpB